MDLWDKDQNQQFDLHMEGGDETNEGNIKKKDPLTKGSSKSGGKTTTHKNCNCT